VFFSNPFFQVFQISIGQQDLNPRTGSWRVLQILATINLAVWVGVAILIWLGVGPGNGYWSPLSIGAFAQLFFSVFTLAYLNLYHLPQKKSSTQP
jgi:threonine/homoserine/homoserine lactone efflux protein